MDSQSKFSWYSLRSMIVPYVALGLVFLSGFGFSVQSLMVKFLAGEGFTGVCLVLFCRGFVQGLVSLYFIGEERKETQKESGSSQQQTPLFGATWHISLLLFLRSILGMTSSILCFTTVEMLPVGDASVLVMLSSIFGGILGVVVLKESCSILQVLATLTACMGGIFISRPTFFIHSLAFAGMIHSPHAVVPANPTGVMLGLIAAFVTGIVFMLVRMLGTSAKMPWSYVTFSQALGQVFIALPVLLVIGRDMVWRLTATEWLQVFITGFVGTFSQFAMTIGMQREKSGPATAMRMSDILFGFIWQYFFTPADHVGVLSVVGAVLVCLSVLMIVLNKRAEIVKGGDGATSPPATAVGGRGGGGERSPLFKNALSWMDEHTSSLTSPSIELTEIASGAEESCRLIEDSPVVGSCSPQSSHV